MKESVITFLARKDYDRINAALIFDKQRNNVWYLEELHNCSISKNTKQTEYPYYSIALSWSKWPKNIASVIDEAVASVID